jgi:xanthine dehydrogenase accessory factor
MITDVDGPDRGRSRLASATDDALPEADREHVEGALRSDRALEVDGRLYTPYNPPLRLLVVGAVHIAQALAPMARRTGYAVTVIDPRGAFAARPRFADDADEGEAAVPPLVLRDDWPDEALDALAPDARTAVVTLTHDPKLDDPALDRALRSDAFYIGALGSRKTHASRLRRLAAAGFEETALARIHGPVGLPIGARSPAEIAISILAQITDRLRNGAA